MITGFGYETRGNLTADPTTGGNGMLHDAERHIRRAIELDASDGWAYIYLGNVLWEKRDLLSAERAFRKATDVWSDDSTAYWCLADFYEHTDRGREADLCYEIALDKDPDDPVANVRFGLYLKETGGITKAKTYLERAVSLDPEDELARSALAELDDTAPPHWWHSQSPLKTRAKHEQQVSYTKM